LHSLLISFISSAPSLNAHVILRGTRSAGYGFVALATADAAQKAVQALDKKELDGRQVIVEIAKPSDQKDKEKKEKKSKRRPGRRGGKAVPGEVSEAEANGDAPKVEDLDAPESGDAAKPKKKKKKTAVCFYCGFQSNILTSPYLAQGQEV
jgi:RNA recognition motif-containing protein